MPKHKVVTKGSDGSITKTTVKSKMRIGSRENGVSALSMSNKDLKAVIADKDKAGDHQNAKTVLKSRGF